VADSALQSDHRASRASYSKVSVARTGRELPAEQSVQIAAADLGGVQLQAGLEPCSSATLASAKASLPADCVGTLRLIWEWSAVADSA
jgi:hypothetical protein